MTRAAVTLLAVQCALVIVRRSVLLKMRNVLDRICGETLKRFVFNKFFFKVVPFLDKMK